MAGLETLAIDGEFCGLPPYEGYEEGEFPVSEGLNERVLTVGSYIEPADGFLDQCVHAFEKVSRRYQRG